MESFFCLLILVHGNSQLYLREHECWIEFCGLSVFCDSLIEGSCDEVHLTSVVVAEEPGSQHCSCGVFANSILGKNPHVRILIVDSDCRFEASERFGRISCMMI